ncbi:unnamed protein product [Ilex paraguariensis]|uniref:Pectinesterase n=1 Tax=Ilex paraguariensis TaxID=185542 RepID=A0ABC8UFN7_9AQUA
MDTIKSFKGYGKVNEIEEQGFRRNTRKRLIILIVSSVILVAVIIGAVVGTVLHKRNRNGSDEVPSTPTSPAAALKAVCSQTQYPESCFNSIKTVETSDSTTDPEEFFKISLQVVLNSLSELSTLSEEWVNKTNDAKLKAAFDVCQTAFDDAVDRLSDSISYMNVSDGQKILSVAKINDLKTWLSTTITDQQTCLDALEEVNSTLPEEWKGPMNNSTEFASNSLAIVAKILGILSDFNIPIHRKLLGTADIISGFPNWVGAGDRRLLQATSPKPQLIVAEDGSGNFKTIKEALAKVPKKSNQRLVIYVKAGVYVENVNLDKSMWNVMMYGDGSNKTIVSGSLNFVDGTPTFSTATFGIHK